MFVHFDRETAGNIAGRNNVLYAGGNGLIVKADKLTKPSIPGYITGVDKSCINELKFYSTPALNNLTYTWKLSGGGYNRYINNLDTIAWTQPGKHTLSVAAQNACGASPQRSVVINVIDFKSTITQKDSVLTATAGNNLPVVF
jgi:hypothetical protein